jgi:hypothetical protein
MCSSKGPESQTPTVRRRPLGSRSGSRYRGLATAEGPVLLLQEALGQAMAEHGDWLRSWEVARRVLSSDKIAATALSRVWLTELAQEQLEERYEQLRAKHSRAAEGDLRSGLRLLNRVLADRQLPSESLEHEGAHLEAHTLGRREWVFIGVGQPRLLCLVPIGGLATFAASLRAGKGAGSQPRRRSLGRSRRERVGNGPEDERKGLRCQIWTGSSIGGTLKG